MRRTLVALVLGAILAGVPAFAARNKCPVCAGPIEKGAAQRFAGGRQVILHLECARKFDEDPWAYARRIVPLAGLFTEDLESAPPPVRGWLYISLYILAGLLFGGVCGYLAVDRGRSGKAWFALGLVGTAAALAALLSMPRVEAPFHAKGLAKVPTTREPRPCPACGHLDHPSSDRCLGCGGRLTPVVDSEVTRARGGPAA